MEEQLKQALLKIDYLEKMINTQQQYLMLSWAILAVIVGVLAFTMFFLIKSIVNDRVEKELAIIKGQLQNDLEKYIDKKPYMRYQMGMMTGAYVKTDFSIAIGTINNNSINYPNRLELFTTKGNKVLKYDANVVMNGKKCEIVIKLYNFDTNTDGNLRWVLSEYML